MNGGVSQHARILAAAFRQGPLFSQRFNAHVKAWERHNNGMVWRMYWTDPSFARAYDERRDQGTRETADFMSSPPWGGKAMMRNDFNRACAMLESVSDLLDDMDDMSPEVRAKTIALQKAIIAKALNEWEARLLSQCFLEGN